MRHRVVWVARLASVMAASIAVCSIACSGSMSGDAGDRGDSGDEDAPDGDGEPEGGTGGRGGSSSGRGGSGGGQPEPVAPAVGPLSVRRLTRLEYDNTVRDLLGDDSRPAAAFPADDVGSHGFATATNTSALMVTTAMEVAEALAARATKDLAKLLPCVPSGAGESACVDQAIAKLARRTFRRPPSADETRDLRALYDQARGELGLDVPGAMRVMLTALLQSPQFLYRWELGPEPAVTEGAIVKLGAWELASRLSYFVWRSMPDERLFEAAASGKLLERDTLAAEAKRLFADGRAREAMGDFFAQLYFLRDVLRTEKDQTKYPDWTSAARASALLESRRFVESVVFEGDGKWTSLLLSPVGFVDQSLAKVYGVAGVTGTELRKVDLPAGQRAGLLTRAAFLAGQAGPSDGALITPIKRGKEIRTRLLCQVIPPPMANVMEKPSSGRTTRERLNQHASDPQCNACHKLMDPLGFAFERFDVVGRYRTTDDGAPVDSSGSIDGVEGETPKFGDAIELMQRLTQLPEAADCFVSSLLRYGVDRADEDGEARALRGDRRPADLDVRELLVSVVTSRGFTHRAPSAGEVLR